MNSYDYRLDPIGLANTVNVQDSFPQENSLDHRQPLTKDLITDILFNQNSSGKLSPLGVFKDPLDDPPPSFLSCL